MKKKSRDEGIQREVELYRDGSGSRVVLLPQPTETPETWLDNMKKVSKVNYGRVTVVVKTLYSADSDYDDYPGCALFLFPGDKRGRLDDGQGPDRQGTILYDFTPAQLAEGGSIVHLHALTLLTNYGDLKELRDALTTALNDMSKRKRGKRLAESKSQENNPDFVWLKVSFSPAVRRTILDEVRRKTGIFLRKVPSPHVGIGLMGTYMANIHQNFAEHKATELRKIPGIADVSVEKTKPVVLTF